MIPAGNIAIHKNGMVLIKRTDGLWFAGGIWTMPKYVGCRFTNGHQVFWDGRKLHDSDIGNCVIAGRAAGDAEESRDSAEILVNGISDVRAFSVPDDLVVYPPLAN